MATTKTPTIEELQAEIERLRSQLDAKSDDDRRSRRRARARDEDARDEINSLAEETNDAALDELYRLVQGVNAATAELLRSGADILTKLNDDVSENAHTNQDDLPKTLNRLPADIQKGYLRALRRAAEVPGRMADKFTKAHRDAENKGHRDGADRDSGAGSRAAQHH